MASSSIHKSLNNRCVSWSVTNSVTSFRVCWWLDITNLLFSSVMEGKAYSCVVSLSPSNKSMWHFTKMDNQNREWPTKIKMQQRDSSDNAGSEIRVKSRCFISYTGVTGIVINYGIWETTAIWETRCQKLVKANFKKYILYIYIYMQTSTGPFGTLQRINKTNEVKLQLN